MTLLVVLALLAQDAPCPVIAAIDPERLSVEDYPAPQQASGPGLWIGGVGFTAADIASVTVDLDSISDEDFALIVNFTTAGRAKFREAQRCRPSQFLEVSIDGRAITRPALMEEITGPSLAIVSGFTRETASKLRDRIPTSGKP